LKPPSALAMSPATEGFSVIIRDLDIRGWNRTQLRDFCKSDRSVARFGQGYDRSPSSYPSFTKYFPGNCLTKRFSSNCNSVDETAALDNLLFVAISSMGVSVASIAS